MSAFEFQALDARGKTVRGVREGDSARQLRQQLRDEGLTPLSVTEVGEGGRGRGRRVAGGRARIGTAEMAVVIRQFAALLSAGLTVEDALHGLVQQAENHQVKAVLSGLRAQVTEGRSLAEATRAFPRTFPGIHRATMEAGERTGKLDVVMERLAGYVETQQAVRQRMGVALVYPVILLLVALAIVVGLMTYVVPQVVKVFEDTGQQLPALTRGLIALSDFLRAYGIILLLILSAGFVAVVLSLRRPGPRRAWHALLLRMPGVRRFVRGADTARMARTLAIMTGSGVPILAAMRSTEGVMHNVVLREDLQKAAAEVTEGVSISRALARRGSFPPLLVQMVASGEASGRLDQMLDRAATVMEREVEGRVAVLVSLFEPATILFMGGVVLMIVIAILLPIFDLNQLIR
jgi:general secretion pathway protein F